MIAACRGAILVEVIILAACYELQFSKNFTALSDDFRIQIFNVTRPEAAENASQTPVPSDPLPERSDFVMVELLTEPNAQEALAFTKVRVSPAGTDPLPPFIAHFPCHLLWYGDRYWLRYDAGTRIVPLDVRWYEVAILLDSNTPKVLQTFQDVVDLQIKFLNLGCTRSQSLSNGVQISSHLQLQLVFCGHSEEGCAPGTNRAQLLHAEEIWPSFEPLSVQLPCELFGQAGRYIVWMVGKSTTSPPSGDVLLAQTIPLRAEWSEQFVFNVYPRSIFPCDTLPLAPVAGGGSRGEQGITVLFTYPQCILPDADRVRVFARREAVHPPADPSNLIYVAEQRVLKGKHSVTFPCALFSENYLEYCFVYVSGARSGAASDVRVECVPTLSIDEARAGAWGAWSAWTQCSTSCGGGGIRNRYRFCDSPPPKYGAKFCEGKSLQSEPCPDQDRCPDGAWSESGPGAALPADSEVVQAEVGPGCRCGCVVHLGAPKPRRLLATSSQSCPGRTFWLVQAEDQHHIINLKIEHFRLACEGQWLKVRDGDSLAATLVAHLTPESPPVSTTPVLVRSSGPHVLLEFHTKSEAISAQDELTPTECRGGFLAHAQQLAVTQRNSSVAMVTTDKETDDDAAPEESLVVTLTAVHLAALSFVALVLLLSAALGAQYTFRYRKYQRASAEPPSPAHSLPGSTGSTAAGSVARFTSSTTLSEIISLKRFGATRRLSMKHERLREDAPRMDEAETPTAADGEEAPRMATLATEDEDDQEADDDLSSASAQEAGVKETQIDEKDIDESAQLTSSRDANLPPDIAVAPTSPKIATERRPKLSPTAIRRSMNFSPHRTEKKRRCKHKRGQQHRSRQEAHPSPVKEAHPSIAAVASLNSKNEQHSSPKLRSTLNSVQEGNRPISTERNNSDKVHPARCMQLQQPKKGASRAANPWHQRVLQAGSSEFSLTGTESEMELDYYDYNVHNASAVPGSYLGMDPAYLIWIPPASPSPDYTDSISLSSVPQLLDGDNKISSMKNENAPKRNNVKRRRQEEKCALAEELGLPRDERLPLRQYPGGMDEKETREEKCSSLILSGEEEDIKFADDDAEDTDVITDSPVKIEMKSVGYA